MKKRWAMLALLIGIVDMSAAHAQSVNSDQGASLEEIVVTAQRRTERLQDVPISAQVISGQALSQGNLNSLEDLSAIVPSVHVGENGRSSDLYIRGVGSGENQAFDQSVGTFVDDIYHGRSRMSAATFLDIDRVEVLKGPQSTFFGNNAIAGAFNITTRKPENDLDISARALYGQYHQYAAEAAVGAPLNDELAVRVAGLAEGTDGWLYEENLNTHVPRERNAAGRVTLLFRPNEQLDATLKVEGSRNRNTGAIGIQIGACPPAAPFTAAGFCAAALAQDVPTGIDGNRIAQSPGQEIRLDTDEYVLTVNYRNWNHTFTSVTGYYSYRYSLNLDGDATPASLLNIQAPERYRQFSQELRVESPTDQPIQYLLGAYYQHDHLQFNQDFGYFFSNPVVTSLPPFASLVPYLPLAQNTDFTQPEDVYSMFGSVSWNATEKLTLSAGLRGSYVRKSYDWDLFYGTATQDFGGIAPLPPAVAPLAPLLGLGNPNTLNGSRTDHAWMPSVKAQYRIDPAVMTYFSYARGFKAGGFNGADNTGDPTNLPYGPEHVNAYEIGLKSTWLDRSLLFNFDLFRSDYTDLQVSTNLASTGGTFVSLVKNAASSRSQGAELELQWAATRQLRLDANATYLDSTYVRYPGVSATQLQAFEGVSSQDLSGKPTEFAPKWSGSLTGAYSIPLGSRLALTTEATGLFSSAYFLSGTDDPTVSQGGYVRLDARVALADSDGHWAFEVIGKNLNDRTILTFAAPYTLSPGSLYATKQSTRSVAAQVRFKWR